MDHILLIAIQDHILLIAIMDHILLTVIMNHTLLTVIMDHTLLNSRTSQHEWLYGQHIQMIQNAVCLYTDGFDSLAFINPFVLGCDKSVSHRKSLKEGESFSVQEMWEIFVDLSIL